MKARIQAAVVTAILGGMSIGTWAQCAMCRATAETATENVDKGIGEGLNSGIVYLMGIPYALLTIAALVFFRKRILAFFKA
jgi:hypothetical protein